MEPRVVMASTFKERCLALLDQVAETRVPLVVTKHGKPVAQVVPLPEEHGARSLRGSVKLVAPGDEAYFSTGEPWEAEVGRGR